MGIGLETNARVGYFFSPLVANQPVILGTPVAGQALPAIYRAIRAGLKGNLGLLPTVVTGDREHLPRGSLPEAGTPVTPPGLTTLPTRLATGGLVFKPLGGEELLLARRKRERLIAVPTVDGLIFVHGLSARCLNLVCKPSSPISTKSSHLFE